MRFYKYPILLIALALVMLPVGAGAISGDSYIVDPSSNVFSSHTNVAGSSYIIDGSVEPMVGSGSGS